MAWKLVTKVLGSTVIVAAIVVCLPALVMGVGSRIWLYSTRHSLTSAVMVGDPITLVIERLGKPNSVANSREEFTGIPGWSPVPDCPIDREVLEYYKGIWKLYVYVDQHNRVSHVFLARS